MTRVRSPSCSSSCLRSSSSTMLLFVHFLSEVIPPLFTQVSHFLFRQEPFSDHSHPSMCHTLCETHVSVKKTREIYRRWNVALIWIQILLLMTKSTVTFFLLDQFRSKWYQNAPRSQAIQIISVIVGFGQVVWKLSLISLVRSSNAALIWIQILLLVTKSTVTFFLLDRFCSKWYQNVPRS